MSEHEHDAEGWVLFSLEALAVYRRLPQVARERITAKAGLLAGRELDEAVDAVRSWFRAAGYQVDYELRPGERRLRIEQIHFKGGLGSIGRGRGW